MVEIGKRLRYLRQKKKMSQKQLAELLHVAPQTISKWELDKSTPDYDQLIALSQLYRKSIDRLLGQGKPTFLDYLADSENIKRSYYGIQEVNLSKGEGNNGSNQENQ